MPGGSNTLNKTSTKPTHSRTVRSVQTLLAAKKDNKDEKEPKAKRTHSEVSNDSNTTGDRPSRNSKVAKIANLSSNYNEQYSRKNNIKVFNFPRRDRQNLCKDFIEMVKKDLDVSLEERDVVAIHRLPAVHEPSPLIVRFFNSDVKRSVMRVRKQLNGKVKFVDDVTQRNMELIHRLEKSNHFEQVWYFNCGVYGRTECGEQINKIENGNGECAKRQQPDHRKKQQQKVTNRSSM
ncbi:unnamed protein product [Mytilus edulis]|uniref:Uncharacterized protein n=1 Tax=Mytilus edulis TaxID=6550 RepID=A0A8S3RNS6_MYTED|nr:unnamed protein product [Mytilus edulis]